MKHRETTSLNNYHVTISYYLPSSPLSPSHPPRHEQIPGKTQYPPFEQPSGGKQIAEVDYD